VTEHFIIINKRRNKCKNKNTTPCVQTQTPEVDFQLLNASGINVQKLSEYDIFKCFVTCSACQKMICTTPSITIP
jgi:hypothetical protein